MSGIKIKPPDKLDLNGVSEVSFDFWCEKLEVYLETEEMYRKFLPGGRYQSWQAAENEPLRIITPVAPDTDETLDIPRRHLRSMLTIIADRVHMDHIKPIIQQSTSLKWIYNKLREDYNIETKGINFLQLLDITWDPTEQTSPVGVYNKYRSIVLQNLHTAGTLIKYKNKTLEKDDALTDSHEDMILLNVLCFIGQH